MIECIVILRESNAASERVKARLFAVYPMLGARKRTDGWWDVGVVNAKDEIEKVCDGVAIKFSPQGMPCVPAIGDHVSFGPGMSARVLARELLPNMVRLLCDTRKEHLARIVEFTDRRIISPRDGGLAPLVSVPADADPTAPEGDAIGGEPVEGELDTAAAPHPGVQIDRASADGPAIVVDPGAS